MCARPPIEPVGPAQGRRHRHRPLGINIVRHYEFFSFLVSRGSFFLTRSIRPSLYASSNSAAGFDRQRWQTHILALNPVPSGGDGDVPAAKDRAQPDTGPRRALPGRRHRGRAPNHDSTVRVLIILVPPAVVLSNPEVTIRVSPTWAMPISLALSTANAIFASSGCAPL